MAGQSRGVLVVVGVVEARGLPARPGQTLAVEGRLGSEALATDPLPLSGPALALDTELGWQMSRKALQQHRMHRTPLKLLVLATERGVRETLGYVLLDLRAAQLHGKRSQWFSLLNCRHSNPRPELLLTLCVEEEEEEAAAVQGAGGEEKGEAQASLPRTLTLTLGEGGTHYLLGPPSSYTNMFTVSLTLHSPTNIPAPPSPAQQWYFYYTLFGNDITSEPFRLSPSFHPERASIRVRSSRELLSLLLASQEDLKVHLCAGDASHCYGLLPLSTLSSTASLERTVHLSQGQDPVPSPPPCVCVSMAVSADEGTLHTHTPTPSHLSPAKPAAVATSVPSQTATTLPPPHLSPSTPRLSPSLTPSRHTSNQKLPSPGPVAQSVRRNLTRSFEEATSSHTSSPHSLPPSRSPPPTTAAPDPQPSNPTSTPPTTALTNSTFARKEVQLPPASTSTHHFMFSIDLRSLHNSSSSSTPPLYLKYSYPFFGCPYPVLVQPPLSVGAGSEASFSHSYCAFEFATSEQKLREQLAAEALRVEVWQGAGGDEGGPLMGNVTIFLSDVWRGEGVKVEGVLVRRMYSLRAPITPHPSLPHSSPLTGHLNVCLVLEDRGAVSLVREETKRGDVEEVMAVKSDAVKPSHALPSSAEYHAAVELELWKVGEEEAWRREMREREEGLMARLAAEWERRDTERQQLLQKKLERHTALERQLSDALRDVQTQRLALSERERELSRDRSEVLLEREHLGRELEERVKRVKEEGEQRLQLERLKVEGLEAQVLRLNSQISSLEQRCRSRETEFERYREHTAAQPESRLQAELSLVQLEKSNLERKLSTTLQSKQHYKEQWSRALQELAALRQREQEGARKHLRDQHLELERLREQLLQQEEGKSISRQLGAIRTDVERLQEQTISHKAPPTSSSSPHPRTVPNGLDADVARWVEERDILLQTGVYTSADPTIQRLDSKIREALSSRTLT